MLFRSVVSGRYISVDANSDPYQIHVQGFTMDASLRVMPIEGLQFDIGALNFIDMNSPFVPLTLAGGVAFAIMPALSIGADVLADMTTFDKPQLLIGGGVEYPRRQHCRCAWATASMARARRTSSAPASATPISASASTSACAKRSRAATTRA